MTCLGWTDVNQTQMPAGHYFLPMAEIPRRILPDPALEPAFLSARSSSSGVFMQDSMSKIIRWKLFQTIHSNPRSLAGGLVESTRSNKAMTVIFCCPLADALLKCDGFGLCWCLFLWKLFVTDRADRMAIPDGTPAMQYQSQLRNTFTWCFASTNFFFLTW